MSFAGVEYARIEAEFLALGGGDAWDRVEAAAWLALQREKLRCDAKQKERRATVFGARGHREYERARRKRNKKIVRAVRGCSMCRSTYAVTAQQVADGNGRFCSPRCAGKWRRARHNPKPTRLVTIDGQTRALPEWAKLRNISIGMVYRRMRSGMTAAEALTQAKRRGHHG